MSKFHNSVGGEKVALSFHALGITLASVMLSFDCYVVVWSYLTPHPETIDIVFWLMFCGGIPCAFYHLFMLIWHVNATVDHAAHMRELKNPVDYQEET